MANVGKIAQTLLPGSIAVQCDESGRLVCKRCDTIVSLSTIAFLTRTSPTEAFEAWCAQCSLILSRWALTGAIDHGWTTPEDLLVEWPDED